MKKRYSSTLATRLPSHAKIVNGAIGSMNTGKSLVLNILTNPMMYIIGLLDAQNSSLLTSNVYYGIIPKESGVLI